MKSFLYSFENDTALRDHLLNSLVGLELEVNRVKANGSLSKNPYPMEFGDRRQHNFIMSDYTEGMFEIATPAVHTFKAAYEELTCLSNVLRSPLEEGEGLWPYSLPPHVPTKDLKWLANYFERYWVGDYHEYLNKKYGPVRGIISGPHINFSLNEELLNYLFIDSGYSNLIHFKNNFYYELAKSIEANRWLFVYLFGCSPVTFNEENMNIPESLGPVRSLRTSQYGYVNKASETIGYYGNFNDHIDRLTEKIKKKTLFSSNEFYGAVRFKGEDNLTDLKKNGVKYIEIRIIDANIFSPYGLAYDDLEMFELLLNWLIIFSKHYNDTDLDYFSKFGDEIALQHPLGRITNRLLLDVIVRELKITNELFNFKYSKVLNKIIIQLQRPSLTPAAKLLNQAKNKEELHDWITNRSNQYQKAFRNQIVENDVLTRMELHRKNMG